MDKKDNEKLMHMVKERPAIWDMRCSAYSDKLKRKQAWEEITTSFFNDEDFEEDKTKLGEALQVRWKNLRDRYARIFKSMKSAKPNSAASKRFSYVYKRQLTFLDDVMEYKPSANSQTKKVNENNQGGQVRTDLVAAVEPSTSCEPSPFVASLQDESNGQRIPLNHLEAVIISDLETDHRKAITNKEQELDDDLHFLMSLHPTLKTIPQHLKMPCRLEIMQILMKHASCTAGAASLAENQHVQPLVSRSDPDTTFPIPIVLHRITSSPVPSSQNISMEFSETKFLRDNES